jgi:hypothetical protein
VAKDGNIPHLLSLCAFQEGKALVIEEGSNNPAESKAFCFHFPLRRQHHAD